MFLEAATSAKGSLGGGTLRVGQGTPGDTDSGIVLNYDSGARITGIRVSCFGEGTLRLGFATQTGSSWSGNDTVEVICNGEENNVSVSEILSTAQVDAVQFNGILGEGTGGVLAVAISGVAN
ncbi:MULTISPECIES: hypothetical protein [Micrococcaceae]|nr:hypothetical protein [Arthrobacter sp. JUb115]MCS3492546.1 hypothetical protein [Arthrobacter sp. JUb119]PQZ88277.1 hypothetical protein CQ016_05910 [Arthrobacter sp. MYb222]PRB76819.1 hypothetical protein CQ012_07380 [Arthrobacter sp. MYb214]TDU30303.1 hypothetical protein EDF61_101262 [Arthrobacter sp. JUb115]